MQFFLVFPALSPKENEEDINHCAKRKSWTTELSDDTPRSTGAYKDSPKLRQESNVYLYKSIRQSLTADYIWRMVKL